MFYDYRGFYQNYRIGHFAYIMYSFKNTLDNNTGESVITQPKSDNMLIEASIKKYNQSLITGIQQNTYQCVETLVTFVHCLKPIKSSLPIDTEIVYNISKRIHHNDLIKSFAKKEENVHKYFQSEVEFDSDTYTYGEHLFYCGVALNDSMKDKCRKSLKEIFRALHIISKMLSDSRMYNSYKHGLRNLPFMQNLELKPTNELIEGLTFDMSNTITFPNIKKDGLLEFYTETVDTDRNIRITLFCSHLLDNIIKARKVLSSRSTSNRSCRFYFVGRDEVDEVVEEKVPHYKLHFKSEYT